jgi:putative membrane protein
LRARKHTAPRADGNVCVVSFFDIRRNNAAVGNYLPHCPRQNNNRSSPMRISDVLIGVIAFLHAYFLVLEMFRWEHPRTRKIFGSSPEFAKASKTLAANLGLYNGFLCAGLIWSLMLGHAGLQTKCFFLVCVLIAGLYGGLTANKKILIVQAVPAGLALALLYAKL